MIRLLLVRVVLFAIPFAIYGVYLWLTHKRTGAPPQHPTPWTWLFGAGLVIVIASFIWLGLVEGDKTGGRYVAPHVENGKIVPGHVEPEKSP
ncbi:MAG: hypothetical protein GC166_00965 [Alphaproteobacteria bacterium]|nr:hypothetical protein [Alphaproteobacteria bacterium]